MSKPDADRNLLFGILALQNNFITREQLLSAFDSWVVNKDRSIGKVLLDQKSLGEDVHALLEALAQKHIGQHGGDVEKSLAAVSPMPWVREDLQRIADSDLQASLGHIPAQPFSRVAQPGASPDDHATSAPTLGAATSAGTRFRILRPHAKGGLGEVYVASDEELHREVALKQIQDRHAHDPDSRSRFMLEAEITGGLEHPGIVPVYGLGTYADGRPFYAMRFVRGDSLKEAIERFHALGAGLTTPPRARPQVSSEPGDLRSENRRGQRPAPSAVDFNSVEFRKLLGRFIDVCNAIQYAHDRGVLHRDLKPGNIMLGSYGETLVVDWGLAKAVGSRQTAEGSKTPGEPRASATGGTTEGPLVPQSGSGVSETQAGQALGTPQYMSPEQAAGRLDMLGPASDVYSLGATLYCLLTGKAPFDVEDLGPLLRKVQRGEFPRPRERNTDIPLSLEAVCLNAMALRPADRFSSPRQMAEDIERWLADEPVLAWPEPWTVKTRRWLGRHRTLVTSAAAALLVALIGGTAGIIWYEHEDAKRAVQITLRKDAIEDALEQAEASREDLHKTLRNIGGVFDLLNQPSRWQAHIEIAQNALNQAKKLLGSDDEGIGPELKHKFHELDALLVQDDVDRTLALRLEQIRLSTATWIEGKFDNTQAERDYPNAFAQAGLAIAPDRQKEVALLIQQSPIKDQLLAALDHWASVAIERKNLNLFRRLLEVARLADPDPWSDKVREASLRFDGQAMVKLAEDVQADRKLQARLSPPMLFRVYYGLGKGKTAETWMRMAQALHPADFLINFELASSLQVGKKSLEAAGFYRVALAIRPNNTAVYNNLGITLHDQKDLPASIDAYHKALAIDPKHSHAWNNLGRALRDQKDLPASLDAFHKALAIDPKDAYAWDGIGLTQRVNKDLPAAIDAYKKAVAIDPNYGLAWLNLGLAHQANNDLPAAIDAFNKAMASDDKTAPMARMSLDNLRQKNLRPTIDAYKKALASDPNNALTWFNLGIALHDSNDLPAAIDAFNRALAINPKYALAWHSLGFALAARKDLPAAIDAYEKSLAIDPKNFVVWNNLGVALRDNNDLSAAIDAYTKALAIDPKYALARKNLGDAQQMLALEFLKQASYTQTEHKGQLDTKDREQGYPTKMTAGKTYVIDMESKAFDTFLKLEDATGKLLAENDDISKDDLNSRLIFTPTQDGAYRIIATSYQQRGVGPYTITIREFVPKK